jgi:hypothetical protein
VMVTGDTDPHPPGSVQGSDHLSTAQRAGHP